MLAFYLMGRLFRSDLPHVVGLLNEYDVGVWTARCYLCVIEGVAIVNINQDFGDSDSVIGYRDLMDIVARLSMSSCVDFSILALEIIGLDRHSIAVVAVAHMHIPISYTSTSGSI